MTAFRCTAKLLKVMKEAPETDPAPASNRLGEWTATLVRVGRIQLVLAVSEPTRFAVAIDAAPCATSPQRFASGLLVALLELEIPAELALAELEAMLPLQVAASNSRSVLGSLNQFAWQADCAIYSRDAISARAVPAIWRARSCWSRKASASRLTVCARRLTCRQSTVARSGRRCRRRAACCADVSAFRRGRMLLAVIPLVLQPVV